MPHFLQILILTISANAYAAGDIMTKIQLRDALYQAIVDLDEKNVKSIIEQGVDVSKSDEEHDPMILYLFKKAPNDIEIIDNIGVLLIQSGAQTDVVDSRFNLNWNCLHYAVSMRLHKTIDLLLEKGVSPNLEDQFKRSPKMLIQDLATLKLFQKHNVIDYDYRNSLGMTLLHSAVDEHRTELDLVKHYAKIISVNERDKEGNMPLHIVVNKGFYPAHMQSVVPVLLKNGANINARGANQRTPLKMALRGHRTPTDINLLLIEKGADIKVVDDFGDRPIHSAVITDTEVLELLIEKGEDINIQALESRNTPLMIAVSWVRKATVRYLLEKGADVNLKNAKGETALNLAKDRDSGDIIAMLIEEGANATSVAKLEQIAAKRLREEQRAKKEAVKNKKAPVNIREAIEQRKFEIFENKILESQLQEKGKTATLAKDEREARQRTFLEEITRLVVEKGNLRMLRHMESLGTDLTVKDHEGYSLLLDAIHNNQLPMAKYLVKKGLDIRDHPKDGVSALALAARQSPEIYEYVEEFGGNIDGSLAVIDEAVYALNMGMYHYFVKERGFSKVHQSHYQHDDQFIKRIINNDLVDWFKFLRDRSSLDIYRAVDYQGDTLSLVHLAIEMKSKSIALYLMNEGATTRRESERGEHVFESVIDWGDWDVLQAFYGRDERDAPLWESTSTTEKVTALKTAFELRRPKVVLFLLDKGADPSEKYFRDETPLHLAAERGYINITKRLITLGANAEAKNSSGKTPLDYAKKHEHKSIVTYLQGITNPILASNHSKQVPSLVGPEIYELYTDAKFFITHVYINGNNHKLSNAEGNGAIIRNGYRFDGPTGYQNKLILNGFLKSGINEIRVEFEPSPILQQAVDQDVPDQVLRHMFAHVVVVRNQLNGGESGVDSYDLDLMILNKRSNVDILENRLLRRFDENRLKGEVSVVYELEIGTDSKVFNTQLSTCDLSMNSSSNYLGLLYLNDKPVIEFEDNSRRLLESFEDAVKHGKNTFRADITELGSDGGRLNLYLKCDLGDIVKDMKFDDKYRDIRFGDFFDEVYVPLVDLEFDDKGIYNSDFEFEMNR